jgi:hypothetical protein
MAGQDGPTGAGHGGPTGSDGPRRVRSSRPASRERAGREARADGNLVLAEGLEGLWDSWQDEARLFAARIRMLADLHPDADAATAGATSAAPGATPGPADTTSHRRPGPPPVGGDTRRACSPDPDGLDEDTRGRLELVAGDAALAMRVTRAVAVGRISRAHRAVQAFPRNLAKLEKGSIPREWFEKLLREGSDLTAAEADWIDEQVAAWDLGITPERFNRELRLLMAWLEDRVQDPVPPESLRSIEVLPPRPDGTACLQVTGPIPEIVALGRRLDAGARAVQRAQRHALADGTELPRDPDGVAASRGRALSQAELRYLVFIASELETGGVEIPRDRFRINVIVPFMTLTGDSDAPATLDGITPIPAEMARALAGHEQTWYRILTDPSSGAFLPLPADRYHPTDAMLEHLRLRNPECPVPGCGHATSLSSECDHIQEFDRSGRGEGGFTEIENLHWLCWPDHAAKTDGHIDPERLPSVTGRIDTMTPCPPGRTQWTTVLGSTVIVEDSVDLLTPSFAAHMEWVWEQYQREHGRVPPDGGPPPDTDLPPDTDPPPPF